MKRALAARCAAMCSQRGCRRSVEVLERDRRQAGEQQHEQRVCPAHQPERHVAPLVPQSADVGRQASRLQPGQARRGSLAHLHLPQHELAQVETDRGFSPKAKVDQDEVGGRVAHEQVASAGVAMTGRDRHRLQLVDDLRQCVCRVKQVLAQLVVEGRRNERVAPDVVTAERRKHLMGHAAFGVRADGALAVDVANSGERAHVGAGGKAAEEIGRVRGPVDVPLRRRHVDCLEPDRRRLVVQVDHGMGAGHRHPCRQPVSQIRLVDARLASPGHHLECRGSVLLRDVLEQRGARPGLHDLDEKGIRRLDAGDLRVSRTQKRPAVVRASRS